MSTTTPIMRTESFFDQIDRKYPYIPNVFAAITNFQFGHSSQFTLTSNITLSLSSSYDLQLLNQLSTDRQSIIQVEYAYFFFCSRKKDCSLVSKDINETNPLIPQTIYLTAEYSSSKYFLVLADNSIIQNGLLRRNNTSSLQPVIHFVKQFKASGNNFEGNLTLPPLQISETGTLSYHILEAKPTDPTKPFWSIGVYGSYFQEFPSADLSFGVTEDYIFPVSTSFDTLVMWRIYTHDQADSFKCKLSITFRGIITNLLINSVSIFEESTIDQFILKTFNTSRTFRIDPDQAMILTIFGRLLEINSIDFIECSNFMNTPVSSTFTSYYYKALEVPSFNKNYTANSICPSGCLVCLNATYCIKCLDDNFWHEGSCWETCPPTQNVYANKLNKCDQGPHNSALRIYTPYIDNNWIDAFHEIYPFKPSDRIVHILYPYPTQYGRLPKPLPAGTIPSLGNSVCIISKLNPPTADLIPLLVYGPVPAIDQGNVEIKILVYTLAPLGTQTVATYDSSDRIIPSSSYRFLPEPLSPTLAATNRYFELDALVDCFEDCQIYVVFEGFLEIIMNDRTVVANAKADFLLEYITNRSFTGSHMISMRGENLTYFSYEILGGHEKYALESFLLEDSVNSTEADSFDIVNCINWWSGVCYSCKPGFYLSLDQTTCTPSCPSGQLANPIERICTTSCDWLNDTKYCRPACPTPKTYFTAENGCANSCHYSCLECFGPESNNCFGSCESPRILVGNECQCPPDLIDDPLVEACVPRSFLNLSLAEPISTCSDVNVTTILSPLDRNREPPIVINWLIISSNATDLTHLDQMRNFLKTQSSKSILIDKTKFESNAQYTLRAWFINSLGENISNTITFDIPPVFNLSIEGAPSLTIDYFVDNIIKVIPNFNPCFPLGQHANAYWTSSPTLNNLNQYIDPYNPFHLKLPTCYLKKFSSYNFEVLITSSSALGVWARGSSQVITRDEIFEAVILNGNQQHPSSQDLVLRGEIAFIGSCPDSEAILYNWTCFVNQTNIIQPCNGPPGFFGTPQSSSSLTYSKNYFQQGDILLITLQVIKGLNSANTTANITIASPTTLSIQLTCKNTPRAPFCTKYSQANDLILEASVFNALPSSLNYTWTSSPLIESSPYLNTVKIFKNDIPLPEGRLRIYLHAQNQTHQGDNFIDITLNTGPENGSITISPESGTSMSTEFTIALLEWEDEDMPLKYSVYFSYTFSDPNTEFQLLSSAQEEAQFQTFLSCVPPFSIVHIKGVIQDNFGATSEVLGTVNVSKFEGDLQESIQNLDNILDDMSNDDPETKLKKITTTTNELSNLISSLESNVTQCPTCSGRGACSDESTPFTCVCTNGYAPPYCALSDNEVKQIEDIKLKILDKLAETYGALGNVTKDQVLETLKALSGNPDANTNKTLKAIEQLLRTVIGLNDPKTILTESQTESLASILDNMLKYASITDCKLQTEFSKLLMNSSIDYLNLISASTLQNKITNENASLIITNNFDVSVGKYTECSLTSGNISASDSAPSISLDSKSSSPPNCTKELSLAYYAINSNLFDCESANVSKSFVSLEIKDPETGESVLEDFKAEIEVLPGMTCPPNCAKSESSSSCQCEDLSVLDVSSQMKNLFANSNLNKLSNVNALKDWQFWKSVAFWSVLSMVVWYLVTILITSTCLAKYSLMQSIKKKYDGMTCESMFILFLVIPPIKLG